MKLYNIHFSKDHSNYAFISFDLRHKEGINRYNLLGRAQKALNSLLINAQLAPTTQLLQDMKNYKKNVFVGRVEKSPFQTSFTFSLKEIFTL